MPGGRVFVPVEQRNVMGIRFFRTVCFILAALFTVAAVKGMITSTFGVVLIVPAIAAITLVLIGIRSYKGSA